MKRKSNQRITKIKLDQIEQLLKKAESISVEDGTIVQEAGSDLTPYPNMNKLRLWTRDYLLSGLTKLYPVDFTDDGQTLYTALIDGLPIFTKLTKSLTASEETEWTQPILSSNGTLGGSDYACLASTEQYPAYYAFNGNSSDYWGPSSPSVPQFVIFYSPNPIKLTSVYFNFKEDAEVYSAGKIEASNDNSTYTQVGSFSGNSSVGLTVYLDTQGKAYKYYKYTFTAHHGSFWGKANITQVGKEVLELSVETTKPGLWLSNLTSPVSNSVAGGWLRHNLINEDSSDFMSVNNDTIGNYSYSFFQRGVIHRDAGSAHGDNDSFCMHWSPSALSCISHDAIVIPGNELQNTYTSYQTLVVPSNPDMQTYSEVGAKNVQFTFVDNNDNIPLSTTTFNGRLVGKDWTYEFTVKPNFSGSGSNYEGQVRCCGQGDTGCIGGLDCSGPDTVCAECIPDDTRSNGFDIEGDLITYDGCTQHIKIAYTSLQSAFNPDADTDDTVTFNESKSGPSESWSMRDGSGNRCSAELPTLTSHTFTNGYYYRAIGFTKGTNCCTQGYWKGCIPSSWYLGGKTGIKGLAGKWTGDFGTGVSVWLIANGDCSSYDGSLRIPCLEWTKENSRIEVYKPGDNDPTTPETNVNVYLCIKDLKAEYEAMGLPWPTDCSQQRFEVSVSTSPCTDSNTTSKLLYENLSINQLGDVAGLGLNDINLNG